MYFGKAKRYVSRIRKMAPTGKSRKIRHGDVPLVIVRIGIHPLLTVDSPTPWYNKDGCVSD